MHECVHSIQSNKNNQKPILCDRIVYVCFELGFLVIDEQHIELVDLIFFSFHKVHRYSNLFKQIILCLSTSHDQLNAN